MTRMLIDDYTAVDTSLRKKKVCRFGEEIYFFSRACFSTLFTVEFDDSAFIVTDKRFL